MSSSIRHFSTNTPVSTKTPEAPASHFSELVKEALAQADSKVHTQHTAPRLQSATNALTLSPFTSKKKTRRRKMSKGEKKAASRKDADATKSKKQKSREFTAEPIPKQGLRDASEQLICTPPSSRIFEGIPTENWVAEPWANQQNDERPADNVDRPFPPHILEQKILSEGTLNPSVTNNLVDVPTVVEHQPVATLCHGLERVLFKYVIYLWLDFLMIDKSAAPVSIGYGTRIQECITSLHG